MFLLDKYILLDSAAVVCYYRSMFDSLTNTVSVHSAEQTAKFSLGINLNRIYQQFMVLM